jgi:hypothetical protein
MQKSTGNAVEVEEEEEAVSISIAPGGSARFSTSS